MQLNSVDYTKRQVYNHKGCSTATLLSDACRLFIRKCKQLPVYSYRIARTGGYERNQRYKKMRKRKRKVVSILAVLLIGAGFAFCCRKPVLHRAHDQIHRLRKLWEAESAPAEAIDFTYWQSKNPDVCAWIRVPGTEIDYPVLQNETEADDYYLSHDIEKESSLYGAIYIEKENSKAFTDPNTVLYGHNMRDGTMFGSLKKFTEKDFFEKHGSFTVYLPEETRVYKIVAAYRYPAEHLLTAFDFGTPRGADAYFQKIPGFVQDTDGRLRTGIPIRAPLVTLSTCTPDDPSMRYLVQGVLTENTKEEGTQKER